jgi:endonuclease-3
VPRTSPPRKTPEQLRRARSLLAALKRRHPDAHCELHWTQPHELLVATILSAQSTDVGVNRATPALFAAFPTPADYAAATAEAIAPFLRTLNFWRNKARAVHESMRAVHERFGGEVPRTMDALLTLRGVALDTLGDGLADRGAVSEGVATLEPDTDAGAEPLADGVAESETECVCDGDEVADIFAGKVADRASKTVGMPARVVVHLKPTERELKPKALSSAVNDPSLAPCDFIVQISLDGEAVVASQTRPTLKWLKGKSLLAALIHPALKANKIHHAAVVAVLVGSVGGPLGEVDATKPATSSKRPAARSPAASARTRTTSWLAKKPARSSPRLRNSASPSSTKPACESYWAQHELRRPPRRRRRPGP